MSPQPAKPQQPKVADIVLYRSKAGVDMAAIITALGDQDRDGIHRDVQLHVFVPPGEQPDLLSHQWGVHRADPAHAPRPGTWRPTDER
jgi:hypothetical protein